MTGSTGPQGAITLRARAEDLGRSLERVGDAGIDRVELDAGALDLLYRGRLHPARTAKVARTVASSGIGVTVHQPASLDLRTRSEVGVMQTILLSLMDLCHELGAPVLVVHYERPSDDPAVEAQFEKLLVTAAERADGLIMAVENIEVAPSALVVDLLERLDHPALGMTWDVGHDALAADAFGYDVDEAARRCAPHVVHIHAQDNFGRYEPTRFHDRATYAGRGKVHWSALGRGDLHLPLGWGSIPWRRLFGPLRARGYGGTVVTEVLDRFYDWHLDDVLSGLRFVLGCLQPDEEGGGT